MLCSHFSELSISPPVTDLKECGYCFNVPTTGAKLCLSCGFFFCDIGDDLERHRERSNHTLFFGLKIEPENLRPQQSFNLKEDRNNIFYELKCSECNVSTELCYAGLPSSLEPLVQHLFIENTDSFDISSSLSPCEHHLEAECASVEFNANSSKCLSCDVSENLWVCLFCGFVGCGRRQPDGSGGNGHALHHYENSKHPLSFKRATLSAESDPDIYCYSCDNFRAPQNLNHLLKRILVDRCASIKTEPTIADMEFKMQQELIELAQAGSELINPGPSRVGIFNLGNTCYASSVFQILAHISSPNDILSRAEDHWSGCGKMPQKCLVCQTFKVLLALIKTSNDPTFSYPPIKPLLLKRHMTDFSPEYSTSQQQDSYEFAQSLFRHLTNTDFSYLLKKLEFSVLQTLTCLDCGRITSSTISYDSLSIPFVSEQDLSKCISSFFAEEYVEYYCSCEGAGLAAKKNYLVSIPQFLLIHVQRFSFDEFFQPVKLDSSLNVSESFSLSSHVLPENLEYLLSKDNGQFKDDVLSLGISVDMYREAITILGPRATLEDIIEFAFNSNENMTPELEHLLSLGFSNAAANYALRLNESDLSRSVEWLYSKIASSTEEVSLGDLRTFGKNFNLQSVVVHKGPSVHAGHYVTYVRENDGTWVLFNDDKVSICSFPPLGQCYLLLYRQT